MGHANYSNLSTRVNRMLHQGPVTIRQCIDALEKAKQAVHASEGLLPERHMLGMAVEEIFGLLYEADGIEPMKMSAKQKKVFAQWKQGESHDWDSGDDSEGGQYGVFDTIRWRALKKRLPVIGNITH